MSSPRVLFVILALVRMGSAGLHIKIDDCARGTFTVTNRADYYGEMLHSTAEVYDFYVYRNYEYLGILRYRPTRKSQTLNDMVVSDHFQRSIRDQLSQFCTRYEEIVANQNRHIDWFIVGFLVTLVVIANVMLFRCFLQVKKLKQISNV